jgi:hypothetical protein
MPRMTQRAQRSQRPQRKSNKAFVFALFAISAIFASLLTPARGADFTVRLNQPFPYPFVGFGAQFNGWIYAFPNTGVGGVNEQAAKILERKIIALRPQHVRIFVEPNGFRQNEPVVQASMLRTFQLAQHAGATINATHWHGPHRPVESSAQNMVDLLDDYINHRGLTALQYVTLQNEPNLHNFDMQRYNALYRAFDERLRKAGLRERIKIIGGDLLRNEQEAWFKNLDENLSNVLDGYSVHMYSDYTDLKHVIERSAEIPPIVASLRPQARKPLYLMEFGFRGQRKGREEPGRHANGQVISDMPLYGLLCGWRMMECLNRGYVALVHWDAYDGWYDRFPMQYGLLGPAKEGWRERPHYYLFRMFTHTAGPGWHSLHIDGTRENAMVSAMRNEDALTVYVMNRADKPQTISIAGAAAGTTFHQLLWNASGDGKLQPSADVAADNTGMIAIQLPAGVIAALTTAATSL